MRKFFSVCFIFLSVFIFMSPVKADSDKTVYCPLCEHRDDDDPLYEKERQFYKKISLIKKVFGDSIDEVALAAAVLHRYNNNELAFEKEYDSNFDSNTYVASWTKVANSKSSLFGKAISFTREQAELIKANEKLDLITTAAIVMIDSNHMGRYSDTCFRDALAGDGLVGNNEDDGPFVSLVNALFCTAYESLSIIETPLDFISDFFSDDNFLVTAQSAKNKLVNISSVCENGYVGGLYNGVSKISDEDQQKEIKQIYAQQIIDFSNYYKENYSKMTDTGTSCVVGGVNGSTQASELTGKSREERINIIGPAAQAVYSKSGVFSSVTIAQAIQESGIGEAYENSTFLGNNNLFGIKCRNKGRECRGGYEVYSSIEESIMDRAEMFDNGMYPGWSSATTPEEQIRVIGPVYCPVSDGCGDYAGTIINIINEYNLKKWDVKENVSSNNSCGISGSTGGFSIRTIKPASDDVSFNEMENDGSGSSNSNRGQCVWYAEGRAYEIVNDLKSKGKLTEEQATHIKELLSRGYGNGGDIYDNAKSVFNSSSDLMAPKTGSYIVWKKVTGEVSQRYGHVAVVEEVNTSSNTITITSGYASPGSCPNDWNCVNFETKTMSLDEFYSSYGKNYYGGYEFSGYVYFLEPLDMKEIWNIDLNGSFSTGARCENGNEISVGAMSLNYSSAVEIPDSLWKNYDSSGDPSIVVVDDYGNVLAYRKPDIRREGASTSKVFSGYAALKLLDVNSDVIYGTKYVFDHSSSTHDFFGPGDTMSVVEAATKTFPGSKNRVADSIPVAIGHKYYSGLSDEEAYFKGLDKMNELYKQIGCSNTNLGTGSGLNYWHNGNNRFNKTNGYSEGPNYNGFTANDLAIVTIDAMKDDNFANHFSNRNSESLFYIKSGTCWCGHGVWGFNKNGKRYYITLLGVKCNTNDTEKHNTKQKIVNDVYNWTINNLIS